MRWRRGWAVKLTLNTICKVPMTPAASMTSTRSLSYIALFAAVIAVFGLIPKIDMPFGVPITLQSLGVMLAGCLLGPRRGFLSLLLFLTAVALGLPLLSSGRGGLAVFAGPTAGFLLGLLLIAHLHFAQAGLAMLVFIPGDLIKCAICAVLVHSVVRGMPSWRLDRD